MCFLSTDGGKAKDKAEGGKVKSGGGTAVKVCKPLWQRIGKVKTTKMLYLNQL